MKRKSKKGIVHTTRAPKWQRGLNTWKRNTTRQMKNVLAIAGAIWVLLQLGQWLLGGG